MVKVSLLPGTILPAYHLKVCLIKASGIASICTLVSKKWHLSLFREGLSVFFFSFSFMKRMSAIYKVVEWALCLCPIRIPRRGSSAKREVLLITGVFHTSQSFEGNSNYDTPELRTFPPLSTRFIRIYPERATHGGLGLRMELLGCEVEGNYNFQSDF